MELHWLRYFVAAAEAGSVSRGAKRLRVAQPSMSLQIRKLERSMGVTLFDRQGRGVALTDAGRALLPRARRILAEVRDAEENVGAGADEGQGLLTIGAIPTMAPYLLPPALGRLRAEFPACGLAIRENLTEQLLDALVDNAIDCAFVSLPIEEPLVETELLGREEFVIMVPSNHPAAARLANIADVRGHPMVVLDEMHCLGQQIQGFCSARRLAPRVTCRTTQLSTVFELVHAGMGLSIVPEMAAAGEHTDGLSFVRLRTSRPTRPIAVAWRRGRSRSIVVKRLVEIVREQLQRGMHRAPRDAESPTSGARRGRIAQARPIVNA